MCTLIHIHYYSASLGFVVLFVGFCDLFVAVTSSLFEIGASIPHDPMTAFPDRKGNQCSTTVRKSRLPVRRLPKVWSQVECV